MAREAEASAHRCFLLELDDDVLSLILRRSAVSFAPAVGSAPADVEVERDPEAVKQCARLAITCTRVSVLVCLATQRSALEGLPRTLSGIGRALDRAFKALAVVRDTEREISALYASFGGWLVDDAANAAFESSMRRQRRDLADLHTQHAEATRVLCRSEVEWRREGTTAWSAAWWAPDGPALMWLAHRSSRRTMNGLCRHAAQLHVGAHGQMRIIEGAMRMYRDVVDRAQLPPPQLEAS